MQHVPSITHGVACLFTMTAALFAGAAEAGAPADRGSSGYALTSFSVDGGGGASVSADSRDRADVTIGQPDAGTMRGAGYDFKGGFWETPRLATVTVLSGLGGIGLGLLMARLGGRHIRRRRLRRGFALGLALLGVCVLGHDAGAGTPLDTSFTVQGRLAHDGAPVNGDVMMTFKLYDSSSGLTALDTLTLPAVPIEQGGFTADLDFSASLFDGSERWLGIAIGSEPEMTPRQRLAPTPNSLFSLQAGNAGLLGGQPASAFTSDSEQVAGSRLTDASVTGAKLAPGAVADSDVSSSAAIAGTKISPNFGSQNIVTTGSVGIGTTSPSTELDVSGTVTARSFVGDGSALTGIAGATGGVANTGSTTVGADTDSDSNGEIALQTKSVTRLVIKNDGTVGIGTDTPLARLSVSATTQNAGNNTAEFKATTIGPNSSHIHYGPNGDWFVRSAAAAGKVVLQDTGGNVGIGTASPAQKLDVNGTVKATAFVGNGSSLTGISTSSLADSSITAAKLAASAVTGAKIADAAVGAAKVADGAISTAKIADGAVSSAKITDGTLTNADISATANIHGSKVVPNFGSETIYAGKAGIGTINPISKLDVISNTVGPESNTLRLAAPAIGPNVTEVHYGANGDWYIRSAANAGKVVIQDTGGNVGIGIASPTQKLEVSGTVKATSFIGSGSALTGISSNFGSQNLLTTGSAGIGTGTPGSKLDVISTTAFASSNTARFQATGIGPNVSHVHHGTSGDWYIRSAASTGKVYIQDTGGNVGIGTTSVPARLTVAPPAALGAADNTATILTAGNARNSHIHYGTNGDWYIRSAASAGKVILQDLPGTVVVGVPAAEGAAKFTVDTGEKSWAISGVGFGTSKIGLIGGANGDFATGVWGACTGTSCQAGHFEGNVGVVGTLSKGGGSFKIDHPLDPEGKYLYHSFVESPDMKNIYDGISILDARGEAMVELPDWFGALNRDFRYQLTCIGGYAPVFIASEISKNQFSIGGGRPGMKVSWQVTGIRQDAFANANRIPVEERKPAAEKGTYLYPEAFGKPKERGLDWKKVGRLRSGVDLQD